MKTEDIVEQILSTKPHTRDSDKELLLSVWEMMGLQLTFTQQQIFLNLPSSETITRIRRKLQELGKYTATKNIEKTRHLKSMIVQQNMSVANIKTAERILEEIPQAVQVGLEF